MFCAVHQIINKAKRLINQEFKINARRSSIPSKKFIPNILMERRRLRKIFIEMAMKTFLRGGKVYGIKLDPCYVINRIHCLELHTIYKYFNSATQRLASPSA